MSCIWVIGVVAFATIAGAAAPGGKTHQEGAPTKSASAGRARPANKGTVGVAAPAPISGRASSLRKGLALIEAVAARPRSAGVTDLARGIGLDKSQVSRLMKLLEEQGYVERDAGTGRFEPGPRSVALAGRVLGTLDLRAQARPAMAELASATGESVHLAVLMHAEMLTVDCIESTRPLGTKVELGQSDPLHCTAVGKAVLAHLLPEERSALLPTPMQRYTEGTITDREALDWRLAAVAKAGFAVDDEEYSPGVRCIAAAIVQAGGAAIGAIGISATVQRLPRREAGRVGRLAARLATGISARMGYEQAPSSGSQHEMGIGR